MCKKVLETKSRDQQMHTENVIVSVYMSVCMGRLECQMETI